MIEIIIKQGEKMEPINIDENCQFLKDLNNKSCNVNRGIYNLICSKRDLKLFCKGIKPHRNFKLIDVKTYFGLFDTNGKENIKNVLFLLHKTLTEKRS